MDHQLVLSGETAKVLASSDDDCIALQSLHLHAVGLLPKGFSTKGIVTMLKGVHLDREHWLLAYESVRQGFLASPERAIKKHGLFSKLLAERVTFYRNKLPPYATTIHPGGAPSWMVRTWVDAFQRPAPDDQSRRGEPVVEMMSRDFERLERKEGSRDEVVANLMDVFEHDFFPAVISEPYSS